VCVCVCVCVCVYLNPAIVNPIQAHLSTQITNMHTRKRRVCLHITHGDNEIVHTDVGECVCVWVFQEEAGEDDGVGGGLSRGADPPVVGCVCVCVCVCVWVCGCV
jgi:hypothetical protein